MVFRRLTGRGERKKAARKKGKVHVQPEEYSPERPGTLLRPRGEKGSRLRQKAARGRAVRQKRILQKSARGRAEGLLGCEHIAPVGPCGERMSPQAHPACGAFGKVIRQKAGIAGRTARGRLPAWPRLEKAHPVRGDVSIPEKASVKRDRAYPARRDVSAWIPAVRRWAAEHSARGGVAQDLRRRMADAGKVPPYKEKDQCLQRSTCGGIVPVSRAGSSHVSSAQGACPVMRGHAVHGAHPARGRLLIAMAYPEVQTAHPLCGGASPTVIPIIYGKRPLCAGEARFQPSRVSF